jgi:hypothetical protein
MGTHTIFPKTVCVPISCVPISRKRCASLFPLFPEVDRSERGRYLTPTDADIEEKFRLLVAPVLGRAKTDTLVELAKRFETLPDMKGLIDTLRIG